MDDGNEISFAEIETMAESGLMIISLKLETYLKTI